MKEPKYHASLVKMSDSAVGIHSNNTSRSATHRFTRYMLTAVLRRRLHVITRITVRLPTTPTRNIAQYKKVYVRLMYSGGEGVIVSVVVESIESIASDTLNRITSSLSIETLYLNELIVLYLAVYVISLILFNYFNYHCLYVLSTK